MKRLASFTCACVLTLALAGCGNAPDQRAASGAVIGGATGALIGGAATGRAGGAVAGGILGAATGAIIGGTSRPYYVRCARFAFDDYGNRFCVQRYRVYD